MTDTDPIQESSEDMNEVAEEMETSTSPEPSETIISSPKPKARSRKKAQPAEVEPPVDVSQIEASPEPEPAVEREAAESGPVETVISTRPIPESEMVQPTEEPVAPAASETVATLGSEPLPSTPVDSFDQSASQAPPYIPPPPQPLSEADERTWAMVAHLSILLNLVTGFLGPVAALVIYFMYKDRSRYVRYHAMQSFVFQLIWWLGAGLLAGITWTIAGLLAVILIGCLLMPIALVITLIPLAALVYGVIGAVQTNEHQDFRYWLIGDWVRGELTGN